LDRHEYRERTNVNKEAIIHHRADDTIELGSRISKTDHLTALHVPDSTTYRFALEWSPHYGTIVDGVLCEPIAGHNAPFRDIIGIHNTDNVEVAGIRAFNISHEALSEVLVNAGTEEGRM